MTRYIFFPLPSLLMGGKNATYKVVAEVVVGSNNPTLSIFINLVIYRIILRLFWIVVGQIEQQYQYVSVSSVETEMHRDV
ncbi:MAG: hypothetical protein ACJ707_06505 [Nitrososphaera sp.]